jgi:hypothetical protein
MPKGLIDFMDDALADDTLLTNFTTKYNSLYDADGNPLVTNADQQMSTWFSQEGYNISKGRCKKLESPVHSAKGKVIPQY